MYANVWYAMICYDEWESNDIICYLNVMVWYFYASVWYDIQMSCYDILYVVKNMI